jgi:hypothetical protein
MQVFDVGVASISKESFARFCEDAVRTDAVNQFCAVACDL